MRLERFDKIRDYRIFKDFSWPRDLEGFGRYNLVYGWNGAGKTTLSNLFKALQAHSDIRDGQIDFIIGGNLVSGSTLSTSNALPQVRVFNHSTVASSVFESSGGTSSQLPPVYVFGEDSAEKQGQLDALKAKVPELARHVQEAGEQERRASKSLEEFAAATARTIKNLLVAPGGKFNNYNAADFRRDIGAYELAPKPRLSDAEYARDVERKEAKPLPHMRVPDISFPDVTNLYANVQTALQHTVVSQVIDGLASNPSLATWIRTGLALHTHNGDSAICQFCEQPLSPGRLRQLEAHFNDEFRRFTESLKTLTVRIEGIAQSVSLSGMPKTTELYPELQEEYARALGQLDLNLRNVETTLTALASALRIKQERVFENLDLQDIILGGDGVPEATRSIMWRFFEILATSVPAFVSEFVGNSTLQTLKGIVEKHNEKTSSFADEVIKARERLLANELDRALADWQQKQSDVEQAKSKTAEASGEKRKADEEARRLESEILEHRLPAEELNRDLVTYLGHDEIRVSVEETGYRIERHGNAAMHLSEGERTAIAFLYFLKSLDDRSFDLANGIIVIDDPISSLDSNAIYSAFGFMKRKLVGAGQLFVLTHNFTFLRLVKNWFQHIPKKDSPKFFTLRATTKDGVRSSSIYEMDPLLKNFESEYHYLFRRVVDASSLPDNVPMQDYYELPNLARRLVESFLAFKIPGRESMFQRLEELKYDGPKTTRISRFLDTYSHAPGVTGDHESESLLSEAPSVLRDVLDMLEWADKHHFERMKAMCT
ncbi:AAA family ATPase [Burkholderia vietnamiensis]|uniref:AAA family ATPase n=1 Tax=Burkholderia vietnamiensis TaxID=60552 RepID=UPI0015932013|nr:AAA family ATPase [Burkholderia vietnamiensis]MCA8070022.1 AAA family ATPase [Burkholderia vietnamiensis]